jgi:hypothetical protein
MSDTIPPVSSNPSPPKTCGLAIWSLVLGILSIVGCLSIFAAIPGVICGHKALSRIKYSGGALAGQGLAIGGLVTGYIGILFAVIWVPMMFAIAVPNFVHARTTAQMNACINNLRLIDGAKQQWALEYKKQATDTPTMQDLRPYIGHGPNGELPTCPAGGVYTLGVVGEKPTCSIPKHQLPP